MVQVMEGVGEAEETVVVVAEVQPSDKHTWAKDEILAFHRL